ncbi:MAG TPA: hypothetical protein VF111_16045 [Thermoanaerobaculia bacterium]
MHKPLFLVLLCLITLSALAADPVPLATNIKFEARPQLRKEAITLVVSPELSQLVIDKKMRLMRLSFPLGNAVAANTESALRSMFSKVRLARSLEEAETPLTLEAKAFEVTPKMPLTTFGTFTSKVKYTFVLRDAKKKSEREIVVEGDGGNKKHAGRVIWESGWKWTEAQQLAKATDLATVDALDLLLEELAQ